MSGSDALPPPPEDADQTGSPDETVKTNPSVPMPNLAGVLAAEAYKISPVVVIVEMLGVVKTGDVKVLLVKVSVPVSEARVTEPVGSVTVPLLLMLEITGVVKVLFVRVTVFVSVTSGAAHLTPRVWAESAVRT